MGDARPPGIPIDGPPPTILLGRYRVDAVLGKGGFGEVVRAFDPRIRRHVAIKTLSHALAPDTEEFRAVRDRFEREAEATSRMGIHPHIVAVYDLIADADDALYLILEYLPGGTLADRLTRGPLPAGEAVRLAADAARGLHAAHRTGIVHRDVKPANLFLTQDGRGKVGDFGVAQIDDLSQRSRLATAEQMFHPGTPLYMSPEQRAKTDYLRGASDEYALGLVLYEMLTGQAYKRLSPSRARELLVGQPPDLVALIARMTADDEERRYETLAEVAAVAEAMLPTLATGPGRPVNPDQETVPVSPRASGQRGRTPQLPDCAEAGAPDTVPSSGSGHAPPGIVREQGAAPVFARLPQIPTDGSGRAGETDRAAPMPAPTGKRVSRRAVLAGVGGVAVVGGVAGVGWALSGGVDRETTPTATAVRATVAPTTNVQPPATSIPATATSGPAKPTTPPTVVSTAAFTLQGDGFSAVSSVAFSPDGQTLASGSAGSLVRQWRTGDGGLIRELSKQDLTGTIASVAFSPDGQMLAAGSEYATVRLWRLGDGTLIRELKSTAGFGSVKSVAFSPDGQTLVSGSSDSKVRLWRVGDGGLIRELSGHTDTVASVAFSPDGLTFASGSSDTTVRLWRTNDGGLIRELKGHLKPILRVAFSPDGQTLASGSSDATVRLWRVGDGGLIREVKTDTGMVSCVAFSPDGQTVASGSMDKSIRLWRTSDDRQIYELKGHFTEVTCVAFASDGKTLASGSSDRTVRLWRL